MIFTVKFPAREEEREREREREREMKRERVGGTRLLPGLA